MTPSTTLQSCLALLAKIRDESDRQDLIPSDRVKLADTEARLLGLRAKLEAEAALADDRIIREHPRWILIKKTMFSALVAHPLASKAVSEALCAVGDV
jgi:hypothetical protein